MSIDRIIGYGVSGAVGASLQMLVGSAVLKAAGYDAYDGKIGNAAIEGLVGGAIVHGGLGLVASLLNPETNKSSEYKANGLISGLTGGVTGAAVLRAANHTGQLKILAALAAGATGMGIFAGGCLALVGTAVVLGSCCACSAALANGLELV